MCTFVDKALKEALTEEEIENEHIKELLTKVKKDDGGFDFDRFKKLYKTKYINNDIRN